MHLAVRIVVCQVNLFRLLSYTNGHRVLAAHFCPCFSSAISLDEQERFQLTGEVTISATGLVEVGSDTSVHGLTEALSKATLQLTHSHRSLENLPCLLGISTVI